VILHRLARWLSGSHDLLKWGAAGLVLGWSAFATAIAALVDSRTSSAAGALLVLTPGLGVALLILSGDWLWRCEERMLTKGADRQKRIAEKERALGIGGDGVANVHATSRRRVHSATAPTGASRLVGRATLHAWRRRVDARGSPLPPSK
jgi:hypothetical protein